MADLNERETMSREELEKERLYTDIAHLVPFIKNYIDSNAVDVDATLAKFDGLDTSAKDVSSFIISYNEVVAHLNDNATNGGEASTWMVKDHQYLDQYGVGEFAAFIEDYAKLVKVMIVLFAEAVAKVPENHNRPIVVEVVQAGGNYLVYTFNSVTTQSRQIAMVRRGMI